MIHELREQIKRDKKYKKFMTIIEMNQERINPTHLIDEIRDIAEIRTKTSLKSGNPDLVKALIHENLKAQAYRSRLSEICVTSARISSQLHKACEQLKDWIAVQYSDELKSCGRTKDERMVVVQSLLRPATEIVKSLELVVSMASTIMTDIDKQHYSLKLTLDGLNLHVNKEHLL